MPDKIVLNTPRYKGEYPLDLNDEPLNALEWRWIKKISGYLPLTLGDGLRGGDPDVYLAFAVIALHRAGRVEKQDVLQAAEAIETSAFDGVAIQFVGETEEEEKTLPPEDPAKTPESEPSERSTGGSSNGTSDPLAPIPLRTGAHA